MAKVKEACAFAIRHAYGSSKPHAVTAAYGNSYGYDNNGNQTGRTIGGTAYTVVFDYENRITEVKQGTTTLASFIYDADGNRVKGTIGGVTTVYVGGLFEYQNGGRTKYYEGHNGVVAFRRLGYGSGNGIFYVLNDQLRSTSTVINQAGVVQANQYYYPYGGNRGGAYSSLTTKRFTGQYHESGVPGGEGLYYYNARWYDAKLGRFASPDSLVPSPNNPQSWNGYSYVLNNPMRYSDPTGHYTFEDTPNDPIVRPPSKPKFLYTGMWVRGNRMMIRERPSSYFQSRSVIAPSDNWWNLGWDWLFQQGPNPRTFGPNDYMTQQLKNDLGVNRARDAFYKSGLSQPEPYGYKFSFYEFTEATLQGNMTAHFLGSYQVTIKRVSETRLAFEVNNRTSRASGTRSAFDRNYTLLSEVPRSEAWWGGNFDQRFVWTEPILKSYTPSPTRMDHYMNVHRESQYFSTPQGLWDFVARR